ncbi:MAG: 1-acyl-sn-glycerol-3-phosphate acyltransferase [Candidatus Kuenenia stuttgartiensis]|nr:1-acyl-sn-glycerol-3-phosphate acyltransferase [Candidatus Kuenenia stuttgartiensis]
MTIYSKCFATTICGKYRDFFKKIILLRRKREDVSILNECFFLILKLLGIVLLKAIYQIESVNKDYIPRTGPLIVAANHFSYMDPIVLQAMFSRRISFLMTELYYEGKLKWFFKLLHCICVRQSGPNTSSIREGLGVLKKKGVLGIFPEGGVSKEGILQPGNPGIGFFVLKSGAPVVPAFIAGTYEALPKGAKIPKRTKIKIYFGLPVTFENVGIGKDDRERVVEITNEIMMQIKNLSV